jgi:hypothetical protein
VGIVHLPPDTNAQALSQSGTIEFTNVPAIRQFISTAYRFRSISPCNRFIVSAKLTDDRPNGPPPVMGILAGIRLVLSHYDIA